MRRFIILTHYEATETNNNYFGKKDGIQNHFSGKNYTHLNTNDEAHVMTEHDADKLPMWMVKEYGYATKASAMKGLKAHKELSVWEQTQGYWKVSCELIEMNIPN